MDLFVYGTFKRGHFRNPVLDQLGMEFVREARTQPEFSLKLVNVGGFPGLLPGDKAYCMGDT